MAGDDDVPSAVAGFRRAEAALDALLADAGDLRGARTSLEQAAGTLHEAASHLASADVATKADVASIAASLRPLDALPDALDRVAERVDAVAAERVLHRFDELESERGRRLEADAAEHRAALDRAVTRITSTIEDGRPALDLAAIGQRVADEVGRAIADLRDEQRKLVADAAEAARAGERLAAGQAVLRRLLVVQAIAVVVLLAVLALLLLAR